MKLSGRKILVVGLGRSGFAAARFLHAKKATVRVTDASSKETVLESASYLRSLGIEVETGGHTREFLAGCDLVVTSPGVPSAGLPLVIAREKGIPVISEVEMASRFCTGDIIGVTGSNGKTTTCNLLHRIFTRARKPSVLCGNVGFSFLEALAEIRRGTGVVLELSSFQLEESHELRPRIAVVLNLSPNHLDRHKTLDDYAAAKERIFRSQRRSDILVLNHDDSRVAAMAQKSLSRVIFFSKRPIEEGVYLEDGRMAVRIKGFRAFTLDLSGMALRGEHNLENAMAAVSVAAVLKLPKRAIQDTLSSFKTLEHRIEPLGAVGGVRFVNDSKSTTLASTRAALLSCTPPIVLVAGGRDKGADFAQIEELLGTRVKKVVLYGESAENIAGTWKTFDRFRIETDFRAAVRAAFDDAAAGDTLLLSPMCTSFDQFASFEARGEAFKTVFKELKAQGKRQSPPAPARRS